MRKWHRWTSTVLGIFLLVIATTGVFIQLIQLVGKGGEDDHDAPRERASLVDPVANAKTVVEVISRAQPGKAISSITFSVREGKPSAVVRMVEEGPPQIVDLATATISKPGEAEGDDGGWEEFMMHIHSGAVIGLPGQIIGLLAGFALLFLSVSGLWMWWTMLRQRVKAGRPAWFWK